MTFDIFLHLGTVLSVLIFFRKDIVKLFTDDRKILFFIMLASVPTFIIGFLFKDAVEVFFGDPRFVGSMLGITGAWLVLASIYGSKIIRKKGLGIFNSILIGIAQGIAVLPGISRSGATIATGILTGLDNELAVRFSFILAIPAILGASVVKLHKILSVVAEYKYHPANANPEQMLCFWAGGITAMLVGILAIKFVLKLLKNNKLYIFGIYCIFMALLAIILFR
jgi:undecaprenyl-diphosphatase